MSNIWLDLAIELQSLAQAGIEYGSDVYDRDRFMNVLEKFQRRWSRICLTFRLKR